MHEYSFNYRWNKFAFTLFIFRKLYNLEFLIGFLLQKKKTKNNQRKD